MRPAPTAQMNTPQLTAISAPLASSESRSRGERSAWPSSGIWRRAASSNAVKSTVPVTRCASTSTSGTPARAFQ